MAAARADGGRELRRGQPDLTANFANAGDPLFTTPPGCLFLHQASFITGLGAFANEQKLTDYNFFPFPAITPQYANAVEGAGDLFGAFHNTPQAAELMKYLVSSQAQTLFVGAGEFLSANKGVGNYPNPMNQKLGAILSGATSFVFDASGPDADPDADGVLPGAVEVHPDPGPTGLDPAGPGRHAGELLHDPLAAGG